MSGDSCPCIPCKPAVIGAVGVMIRPYGDYSFTELIKLYDIMTHTDGIYGGRFSGAGFKGCCMALIDPAYEEDILEKVGGEYLSAFPGLKGKYSAHICRTSDGVTV